QLLHRMSPLLAQSKTSPLALHMSVGHDLCGCPCSRSGYSGHDVLRRTCLLLTQSGHGSRIAKCPVNDSKRHAPLGIKVSSYRKLENATRLPWWGLTRKYRRTLRNGVDLGGEREGRRTCRPHCAHRAAG